jgi:hypothetical protein
MLANCLFMESISPLPDNTCAGATAHAAWLATFKLRVPSPTTSGCTIVKQSFIGPRFQRSLSQLALSFLFYSHWTDRRESINTNSIPITE